jgi:DNA-binding transcriptional LysR family regulator
MEVFARVVEKGGFSAAARSLDLTPSAISKLIARLEARLGTRLFVRTTRALTLTEEGETYHRAALRIVQELNEADQTVIGGGIRGRLCVSSSLPFGRQFIAPAIPSFLEHYPEVLVDLSLTDQVIDLLAQRTDVAIRSGNLTESGLLARKLAQSRMVVCAAPSYLERKGVPQTPSDLKNHECMRFNFRRSSSGWPFLESGREQRQSITGNLQLNNGDTMREMALAGAGIARLAVFHVGADLQAGALVPVLEPYNPGDLELVHAVYVGGGNVPRRVRAFIDHLLKALGDRSTFELPVLPAGTATKPKIKRPAKKRPTRH